MSPVKHNKTHIKFDLLSMDDICSHFISRLSVQGSGHTLFCACGTSPCMSICGSVPLAWEPHPKARAALELLVRRGMVEKAGAYLWLHPSSVPAKLDARRGVAQR